MEDFKINDKKVIRAWTFFDWANSVYSLVISTAIFPIYFISITNDQMEVFGMNISNSALYSFVVAFSYVLISLISPLLGGMADYGGKRLFFLKFFTSLGAIGCMALFFFLSGGGAFIALIAFGIATFSHAGSLIFYDSFLPQIVTEDRYDKVSARGYMMGYIGSVLLLIFIIWMSIKPAFFGIPEDSSLPYRIGFLMVGIWWIGFAQITFKGMPKSVKKDYGDSLIKKGYQEVRKVWRDIRGQKNILRFLLAFFFYSSGVNTVIYLATVFAEKELHFAQTELIAIVLLLQLVAIGGAYMFAKVAKAKGSKLALLIMICIWIFICFAAYLVTSKMFFYIIAACVGIVLGGIQSISRSSYAKLLESKTDDLASYFSFYNIIFYLSVVTGTFSFGLVEQLTQNIRYSVLALAVFFVIGLIFISKVTFGDKNKA